MSQPNEKDANQAFDPETNPYEPDREAKPAKSGWGCCLWGCLISFGLAAVLFIVVGVSAYSWFSGQVNRWTSETAAELPTVESTEEEVAEIRERFDSFSDPQAENAPDELVITADEINAMIAQEEEFKGRLYVTIENGQVAGEVSIPTDFLPGGKGRFFNASATFDVALVNGVLFVTFASAEVKGEQVPTEIMEGMKTENLAKEFNRDPKVVEFLRRVESLSIEDNKIILKARPASSSNDDSPAQPDAEPAPDSPAAPNDEPTPDSPAVPDSPVPPEPASTPAPTDREATQPADAGDSGTTATPEASSATAS